MVLSQVKGFNRDAFKLIHPAGELGRQLMSRISEIMITGSRIPMVKAETPLGETITEMKEKSLGFTLVGSFDHIEGIITDGDLRRMLLKKSTDIAAIRARDVMRPQPKSIGKDELALDAWIHGASPDHSLVVTDPSGRLRVVHRTICWERKLRAALRLRALPALGNNLLFRPDFLDSNPFLSLYHIALRRHPGSGNGRLSRSGLSMREVM